MLPAATSPPFVAMRPEAPHDPLVQTVKEPTDMGLPSCKLCPPMSEPSLHRLDSTSRSVSSDSKFWVFRLWNFPPSNPYSSEIPGFTNHLGRPTSPVHSTVCLTQITKLSHRLRYYSVVRLLIRHRFPLRLFAYRVPYPDALREPNEISWGHAQIFRTVPSANTLVRWVDE